MDRSIIQKNITQKIIIIIILKMEKMCPNYIDFLDEV